MTRRLLLVIIYSSSLFTQKTDKVSSGRLGEHVGLSSCCVVEYEEDSLVEKKRMR